MIGCNVAMSVMFHKRIAFDYYPDDKNLPKSIVVKIPSGVQFERILSRFEQSDDEAHKSKIGHFKEFANALNKNKSKVGRG